MDYKANPNSIYKYKSQLRKIEYSTLWLLVDESLSGMKFYNKSK